MEDRIKGSKPSCVIYTESDIPSLLSAAADVTQTGKSQCPICPVLVVSKTSSQSFRFFNLSSQPRRLATGAMPYVIVSGGQCPCYTAKESLLMQFDANKSEVIPVAIPSYNPGIEIELEAKIASVSALRNGDIEIFFDLLVDGDMFRGVQCPIVFSDNRPRKGRTRAQGGREDR